MRVEAWIFGSLTVFTAAVTPTYWFMSKDPTGTTALVLACFLNLMLFVYFLLIAGHIDLRPEDKESGEIREGAGELGFFPPSSVWPLYCAGAMVLIVLAPVFGWWLLLLGIGVGFLTCTGWVYEFYRGDHAH